jgi:hypothetical protein
MKPSTVLAVAALAILMVSTVMAGATEKVELIKGEFRDGKQMLAVRNNTSSTIGTVAVNCGFFRETVLVDSAHALIHNVLPGQMGYDFAYSDARGVTSVDCRIQTVYDR